MTGERICIVITVFGRQGMLDGQVAFLDKHLDPALGVDLIVYDDGSPEPMVLPPTRHPARLLRGAENLGLVGARNAVFRRILDSHDYVVVLDDDIRLYNVDAAIAHGIALLGQGFGVVSFPYIDLPVVQGARIAQFRRLLPVRRGSSGCFFAGCSIMPVRVLKEIGLFEATYRFALEEEDYSLRLYAAGVPTTMLLGERVLALHDHAAGKDHAARAALLLSNRFLYHRKFITSRVLRTALNGAYAAMYSWKRRSFGVVGEARTRYLALRGSIVPQAIPAPVVLGFLWRRYLA